MTKTETFLTEFVSASPEETEALGRRIGGRLGLGSVIVLRGKMGSGKTCLTRGIAHAMGITENITSPTYTIINEYRTADALPFYHIDAWRLSGEEDFESTGGPELISGGGIAVIEWGDRIPHSLPEDAIFVSIEIGGDESRIIRVSGMEALP